MSIRVGVIGYGFVGKVFHIPYLKALPEEYTVTVLGSGNEAALTESKLDKARRIETYEEITRCPDVDLVVIASPNSTHYKLTKEALLAGKHVVCDKPFVVEIQEARELVQLSTTSGRLLSVFQNRRYDSCFLGLKETLTSGTVGKPLLFTFNWERCRLEVRDRWREKNMAGSGIWYDLGPHMLDQCLVLFGLPKAITVHLAQQREGAQIDDFAHALLEYPNQLRVILHMSMVARPEFSIRYILHGTRGSVRKQYIDIEEDQLKEGLEPLDPNFGVDTDELTVITDNGTVERRACPKGCQLEYYRKIADAIKKGQTQSLPSHHHILAVVALLKAGYLSHLSSRTYSLTEVLTPEEIAQIEKSH